MLKDWFRRLLSPAFDWMQVEVTTRCDAACTYCPRTLLSEAWVHRDMPGHVFEKLLPAFAKTQLIFLQGWGESLLHPDFTAMVRRARKAGCTVGTTTNGMSLDADMAKELVKSGLDILALSLAGVGEKNDSVRKGTHFSRVLSAVEAVNRAKADSGKATPAIHIAYMLLRSGLQEVTRLPGALEELGVGEVVISTLDFLPKSEFEHESFAQQTLDEFRDVRALLDHVTAEGMKRGVRIHSQLPRPGNHSESCTENPRRALFVAADGDISPCVFSCLPVSEEGGARSDGEQRLGRVVFGNVHDSSIGNIWKSQACRSFRSTFGEGRIPGSCEGCIKLSVE